jgi:hypothetical protein
VLQNLTPQRFVTIRQAIGPSVVLPAGREVQRAFFSPSLHCSLDASRVNGNPKLAQHFFGPLTCPHLRIEDAQLLDVIEYLVGQLVSRLGTSRLWIDFEAWGDYLGDPPLAMAFLDRVVDGALLMNIPPEAQSHRASRARRIEVPPSAGEPSSGPSGKSSPSESSSKSVTPRTNGKRSAPKSA